MLFLPETFIYLTFDKTSHMSVFGSLLMPEVCMLGSCVLPPVNMPGATLASMLERWVLSCSCRSFEVAHIILSCAVLRCRPLQAASLPTATPKMHNTAHGYLMLGPCIGTFVPKGPSRVMQLPFCS